MFNKLLFNRSAYDRIVALPSINLTITASGTMRTSLVIGSSPIIRPISGLGSMSCKLVMQQNVGSHLQGRGEFEVRDLTLRLRPQFNRMTGHGELTPKFSVETPIRGDLSGKGTLTVDDRIYIMQYMEALIESHGTLNTNLVVRTDIYPEFSGTSNLKVGVGLHLPLSPNIEGSGDLIVRRLSALNENILELDGINLLPGETVTIDTDLLQVLFGVREDVSSVTSDSVFFELSPGENEIVISTDVDGKLDVIAIWQNRWL